MTERELTYRVLLTRQEASALRLAAVFGGPYPKHEALERARAKLQEVEERALEAASDVSDEMAKRAYHAFVIAMQRTGTTHAAIREALEVALND